MATIIENIHIKARTEAVWDALRDVGRIHERLARGFVTGTVLEGEDRIVTFANGFVARERIVSLDDDLRRLAYSVVSEQLTHHNASFQVFADGADNSHVIWIADLLPHELAEIIGGMMRDGAAAMRRTLEGE